MQDIFQRDVNTSFKEFLEQIVISFMQATVTDPYTHQVIESQTLQLPIMVSWHDVTQSSFTPDSHAGGMIGLLMPGDAYCVYQGNINLFTYGVPTSTVKRNGIEYIVEKVTNPNNNRWVIYMHRRM